jgi:nitrogen regulatory protein PII
MTVSEVRGCGRQRGCTEVCRGTDLPLDGCVRIRTGERGGQAAEAPTRHETP